MKLAIILPVASLATASVERAFSVMNIVKNQPHNRMGGHWLNDSLFVYIENDIFNYENTSWTIINGSTIDF